MNETAAVLLVLVATSSLPAMTVAEFRALPDHRIAVHTSYGVRYARPLSGRRVEIAIGVSVSQSAAHARAYRVISFDDDNYAYEKFVRPVGAGVRKLLEARGAKGCPLARFDRTIVTLDLPKPMKSGKTYYILAQGGGRDPGLMVTAAHTAQGFTYKAGIVPPAPDNATDLAVMGLRKVEPVGPGLVLLAFGVNFSPQQGGKPENYKVAINGRAVKVVNLGRRTMVETYIPGGWPYKAVGWHEIFLELARPVDDGDHISVEASPSVTTAARRATMKFDAKRTLSNSIKVNQIGYLTDSPIKVAYVGRWMGSFPEGRSGGNPALLFKQNPSYAVCELKSGKAVFRGKAELIHKSGTFDEGVYKHDHSGENVYLIDFTDFKTAGRYFISIPRVGRSLPFEIGDNVYSRAFAVQSHGVYTQRCGIKMGPPYTNWRRIACHKKGITPTTQNRGDKHNFKDLPKFAVKGGRKKLEAFGGHHDAGDYNPRSHIDVAQSLMDAYEIAPRKFHDGQLNIPEKNNGIPDILDEARWAMRLWFGLQDTDGGVYNGTESNGDPNFIQSVELDVLGDYAYAKDAAGSFTFAGVMAQASRISKSLGRDTEAADFLARAGRAYQWAMKNEPESTAGEAERYDKWLSPMAYAAAEMLLTTGDKRYDADFLKSCVWSRKAASPLDVHRKYNQQRAAWAYARCGDKVATAKIRRAARRAIIADADYKISKSATMAYAFVRHPWAPINWGTGAYQNFLTSTVWSWYLTGSGKYKLWMVRTCDNTLGANPLNRSYIVGAGTRTVRCPLHNSRYSHFGEVVDGQQVEGPHYQGAGYRVTQTAYPKIKAKFASLYTFCDNHFCIAMDEGVVKTQAKTLAVFGLLLPDAK